MKQEVKLSKTYNINNTKVTSLFMREPTVGDMLNANKISTDEVESSIYMMSSLCDCTPEDIKTLSFRDYGKLQDVFLKFSEDTSQSGASLKKKL